MQYKVVISNTKHTFPLKGLNELLGGRMYDYRTKKYHNAVKSSNDSICLRAIKKRMNGVRIKKPIRCTFYVYAQNKRHDRGNLYCSAEKSFLDALQLAKVIPNDGFDDVLDSVFHTEVCKENPRIEVIIEEVD